MKKILVIAWKDLSMLFYDKAAWILMLAAPFVLTLGMAAVSGSFSQGGGGGLRDIPVVIYNLDEGPLGEALAEAFTSEGVEELFNVSEMSNEAEARMQVENDQAAAAVIIPSGFSAGMLPNPTTGQAGPPAPVELYSSPVRPLSASIVQSIVTEAINRMELAASGAAAAIPSITIHPHGERVQERIQEEPNFLAYLAPGMAVFFLMYTVSQGGRGLLTEREMGALPRILASPTSIAQVLAGKVLSIFTAGFLQVSVLVLVAGLMFGLDWGHPLGVAVLVASAAAAATGWGILLASVARTPHQVSSVGSALMLLFGILGGAFFPIENFSYIVRLVSKATPNAWAMDGFALLAGGGSLSAITVQIGALLAMAALLFGLATLLSKQRWASGF